MSEDRILTLDEVAALTQVEVETIRAWIMAVDPEPRLVAFPVGRMPRSRKGRCDYRVRISKLYGFLAARESALSEAHAAADWQPKPTRPINRATGRTTLPPLREILAEGKK